MARFQHCIEIKFDPYSKWECVVFIFTFETIKWITLFDDDAKTSDNGFKMRIFMMSSLHIVNKNMLLSFELHINNIVNN